MILRHGDQTRLDGVKGQRSDTVKVTPQRVLGIPRFPEGGLFPRRQLRIRIKERGILTLKDNDTVDIY